MSRTEEQLLRDIDRALDRVQLQVGFDLDDIQISEEERRRLKKHMVWIDKLVQKYFDHVRNDNFKEKELDEFVDEIGYRCMKVKDGDIRKGDSGAPDLWPYITVCIETVKRCSRFCDFTEEEMKEALLKRLKQFSINVKRYE